MSKASCYPTFDILPDIYPMDIYGLLKLCYVTFIEVGETIGFFSKLFCSLGRAIGLLSGSHGITSMDSKSIGFDDMLDFRNGLLSVLV